MSCDIVSSKSASKARAIAWRRQRHGGDAAKIWLLADNIHHGIEAV